MGDFNVQAPVRRVELFEDRASVTREVALPAEPGRHRLVIGPITPLVRARALSTLTSGGVVVEETSVRLELVTRQDADPEEVAKLATFHDEHRSRADARDAEAQRAQAEVRRRAATAGAARAWAGRALLEGDDPAAWLAALRELEDAEVAAQRELQALITQRDLDMAAAQRVQGRLNAARMGTSRWRAWLVVSVLVETPGALSLRYTVPCAVWRPVHRAHLRDGAVTWEAGALAWNATGEDWDGVEVVCSTERPGEHATPPLLTEDVLRSQPRQDQVHVEAREETVELARQPGVRAADQVLGVDDGGQVRVFTAARPAELPSTGRPVWLELERWTSPAQEAWVATPEKSGAVVLRSRQVNGSARPLLAGPVHLVRGSGAVGRGQIKLVPPGEPFELGWGSHDGLRISRRQDIERETSRFTGSKTVTFSVDVRLSNLSDAPVTVQVRERLPVSELKEVKVGEPKASPTLTGAPDRDGFCHWDVTVPARGRSKLTLTYTVEAASKVALPW